MGSRNEEWLRRYLPLAEIAAITSATASIWAEIRRGLKRSGNPIPSNDAWNADLARQHARPVLSNDARFGAVADVRRIAFRPCRHSN